MIVDTTKINGVPVASLASNVPVLAQTIRIHNGLRAILVSDATSQRIIAHRLSDRDVEQLIIARLDAQEAKQETTSEEQIVPAQAEMSCCTLCGLPEKSLQLCIVCEREICQNCLPADLRPGDHVICLECDKITPNREQASRHYWQRQRIKYAE